MLAMEDTEVMHSVFSQHSADFLMSVLSAV